MSDSFFSILISLAIAIAIIAFLFLKFFENGLLSIRSILGSAICSAIFIAGLLIFWGAKN